MIGPGTSSGEKSSSEAIATRPAYLHGFEINPPNSGLAVLKIYDNASAASGIVVATATVAAGQNSLYLDFRAARVCNNGIYASLTGTTTYIISYSLG